MRYLLSLVLVLLTSTLTYAEGVLGPLANPASSGGTLATEYMMRQAALRTLSNTTADQAIFRCVPTTAP